MLLEQIQQLLPASLRFTRARLFHPDMLPDPYPTYAKLRSEDPVHWDEADRRWALTRYVDVAAILRSPLASAERPPIDRWFLPAAVRELAALRRDSMLNCDARPPRPAPPAGQQGVHARAVETMTMAIQAAVDGFLDPVQPTGRMDVIGHLAYPLPVTVIAQMLGVDPEDRAQFKHWSDDISVIAGGAGSPRALGLADLRRAARAFTELTAYFGRVVADRRQQPRNDLLTAMAQAEESGDRLSENELFANAALLLSAGHETTTNLIGNGVLALLRHPDQWERVRRDPTLVPTAVDELLRYDSPVQFTNRILTGDLILGGKHFAKGSDGIAASGSGQSGPGAVRQSRPAGRGPAEQQASVLRARIALLPGCAAGPAGRSDCLETLLRRMPNLRLEGAEPQLPRTLQPAGPEIAAGRVLILETACG